MARVSATGIALVLGLSMTACLPPWDVQFLPEDPFVLNRAPYLVGEPTPAPAFIQTGNGAGCTLEFSVNVADPDVDDTVRVRYYVDFSENKLGFEKEFKFTNDGQEERPPTDRYLANVEQVINPLHPPTSADAPHIVEAVVFDGSITADRQPEDKPGPKLPDGGELRNPSFVVIHRWVVQTLDGQPCP